MFFVVNLAGAREVGHRTSDVDRVPRLLPEVRPRSVNCGTAATDTNIEDSIYLNDDMDIEDDIEEFFGSDLFGFQNIQSDVANEHGPAQSGQQTTSSGNNSVRLLFCLSIFHRVPFFDCILCQYHCLQKAKYKVLCTF